MSADQTQIQGDDESRRAQQLSLQRNRPPTDVPGYEPERFLGAGAYGEVWVAIDRNTGRRVAIKFYTHRGGLDWTLVSREVEKLVFLSADRYVVQLLDVGWEADPPYYVMEYLEHGSLDDRLRSGGVLPVADAVALFRDVAVGLLHAHGKGVLHCDLKPANLLLDQDGKPRLADFGQSRLSHEQAPALGTLFYMAPEQADLTAMPDARWDVYALGALLHTMLTGSPPHRSDAATTEIETASNLEERLARYRRYIERQPPPSRHRQVPGVDRALAEIVNRCLEVDPQLRYPTAQAVIEALDRRQARRARRPLVVLGAVGPALLLLVMGLAAWWALQTIVSQADTALTRKALESKLFATQLAAKVAANDLERLCRAVEQVAHDAQLIELLATAVSDPTLGPLRQLLNRPDTGTADRTVSETTREQMRRHRQVQALQEHLNHLLKDPQLPRVASWFVDDPQGLQLARSPWNDKTVGANWAWRTYFHGQPDDQPPSWRPPPGEHLRQTHLSSAFLSQATSHWILGVSTPVYSTSGNHEFLGVAALTVEVGSEDFGVHVRHQDGKDDGQQFAVLVDWRNSRHKGLVVQHPLLEQLDTLPQRFADYKVGDGNLPPADVASAMQMRYDDPLAQDPRGAAYEGPWLAVSAPVYLRDRESGLRVIVQGRHEEAIGPTLEQLQTSLSYIGLAALACMLIVWTSLWSVGARAMDGVEPGPPVAARGAAAASAPAETIPMVGRGT
ncbi:MAG: hypothetical protein A2W31_15660 [Planctomycetes bacterium RBG_16_64_10]|nr:MAG: hypothetical protein A2W31_15660 [Planctomycetes bacterium RBG_16_64_10]